MKWNYLRGVISSPLRSGSLPNPLLDYVTDSTCFLQKLCGQRKRVASRWLDSNAIRLVAEDRYPLSADSIYEQ